MMKFRIYFGIILALIIIISAYFYFRDNRFESSIVSNNNVTNINYKVYIDEQFGIYFNFPEYSTVIDSENQISLSDEKGNDNWIVIKKVMGDKVSDSNGKFGRITYQFIDGQWFVTKTNEKGGETLPIPIDLRSINNKTMMGQPIFSGAIPNMGWGKFVYIVALTPNKFLIIEGPDNDIPLNLAKSITVLADY